MKDIIKKTGLFFRTQSTPSLGVFILLLFITSVSFTVNTFVGAVSLLLFLSFVITGIASIKTPVIELYDMMINDLHNRFESYTQHDNGCRLTWQSQSEKVEITADVYSDLLMEFVESGIKRVEVNRNGALVNVTKTLSDSEQYVLRKPMKMASKIFNRERKRKKVTTESIMRDMLVDAVIGTDADKHE